MNKEALKQFLISSNKARYMGGLVGQRKRV